MYFYIMRNDNKAIMGTDCWLTRTAAVQPGAKIVAAKSKHPLDIILQKCSAPIRKNARVVSDQKLAMKWDVLVTEFGALKPAQYVQYKQSDVRDLGYNSGAPYAIMRKCSVVAPNVEVPAEELNGSIDATTDEGRKILQNSELKDSASYEGFTGHIAMASPKSFTDETMPSIVLSALSDMLDAMEVMEEEVKKANGIISDCEDRIMDMEHYIEFFPLDVRRGYLAEKELHKTRVLRREYKDILELDRIVRSFFSAANRESVRQMIHEIEKKNDRIYTFRNPEQFNLAIPECMKRF